LRKCCSYFPVYGHFDWILDHFVRVVYLRRLKQLFILLI